MKVQVASEPNLAPLPTRTTPKPRDLIGLGSHKPGSKTPLQGGRRRGRQRGAETRQKASMKEEFLELVSASF